MLPFFLPIFYGSFKLFLWNASEDCPGFLDYLGICFKVLAMQEITRHGTIWSLGCTVDASSLQCCGTQATLAKSTRMRPSIILMKNPLLKKFWLFSIGYDQEVFFIFFNCEKSRQLSSCTSHGSECWTLLPFFCLLLLASLILQRGMHNCFHKTSDNLKSIWHTDVHGLPTLKILGNSFSQN